MKIAKYVGDLLYNYECVVIPGLGGFLTSDKSATINSSSNLFKPPFKQIHFNAYLKTNDGLLVNYIAREEGVEYKEAKEQVDRFVLLCDSALREGKRINFHRIGYLYLNQNQKIAFEQDNSVNYNPDAFGLTSFISPAIYKVTPEEILREKVGSQPVPERKSHNQSEKSPASPVAEPQKKVVKTHLVASKRISPYRTQMTLMSILILLMLVGWGFMHKTEVTKYYNNYTSVIPWIYSSPNAYLADNINHEPFAKMSKSKTGLWIVSLFDKNNDNTSSKKIIAKKSNSSPESNTTATESAIKTTVQPTNELKVAENKPATENKVVSDSNPVEKKEVPNSVPSSNNVKQTQNSSASGHIYIIAGAFKDEGNAANLIQKLRAKGYPAVEAGITRSGLHRVAFGDYNNKVQAEQQLLAIREKENPSAWIFEN
ncbi:MAG: SPOR domain-containing protein [Bacteroidales bacterium]|nr:SPOR domain-containing protein [Bacteroidales bacterium]